MKGHALWLILFAASASAQGHLTPPASDAEAIAANKALLSWFECRPCRGAELKAVVAYGTAAVPRLAATLKDGLSPATRESLSVGLAARYDELDAQARGDPRYKMGSAKAEFVARYVDYVDMRYRVRAAQALAAIGGVEARGQLESALTTAKSPRVKSVIKGLLQSSDRKGKPPA